MSVITVQGLSKRYRVAGKASHDLAPTTFREALTQTLTQIFKPGRRGEALEDFWALRDVSFSVDEGTKLGIIGRNGAGKSTLLKILSRITQPTEGMARLHGRTASLLEVGTGFHPDLTGRENIYLNGALLGLKREDVKRRLEQIVDFAGVSDFLDVPVKRYSSGMYVRLAFAVAAHVEPDILILDEVLAVGDLEFQRKCFGKMKELGAAARSVVFVSHDLTAISALCDRCILLEKGRIAYDGAPSEAIQLYYGGMGRPETAAAWNFRAGDASAELVAVQVTTLDGVPTMEVDIGQPFRVGMRYRLLTDLNGPAVPNFHFFRPEGVCAFNAQATDVKPLPRGEYLAEVTIPGHLLNEGAYAIGFALTTYLRGHHIVNFYEKNAVVVNIRDSREDDSHRYGYAGEFLGVIRPRFEWRIRPIVKGTSTGDAA